MLLILLHILLLAWLSRFVYQKLNPSPLRWYYWPALAFKLACGFLLGMLYFLYYNGGDTLSYHHDAAALAQLALRDFPAYLKTWGGDYPEDVSLVYAAQPRALLTAKLFSPFYVLTGSNYWLVSAYISLLSFFSVFFLAHRLVVFRPHWRKAVALAFLFWPSFVFWTSGLLKESVAMVCIAYSVAVVLPYLLDNRRLVWYEVLAALPLLVLLFRIKYYYAGLLIPFLACLLIACWLKRHFKLSILYASGLFVAFLLVGGWLVSQLHPNMYAHRFLEVWVNNYYLFVEISKEGSFVVFEGLQANWLSVLQNAPEAVFAGLFAPLYVQDFTNPMAMAAVAENLFLLVLAVLALFVWLLKVKGHLSLPAFATLLYILTFALLIAIAAPNYGTLLRYRISYQPFFVLLVLLACRQGLMMWSRK
ncbi:hypothetical protein [Nafulsella turpanensis]|uniref:hypothetical protein n=1 Tax=Nafulsella turpanensis TaxID=1265690 RepID=UPI00034A4FF6|nr:hypothetical protein [Nafulsella turpanensis]